MEARDTAVRSQWRQRMGRAGVWVPGTAIDDDPRGFASFVEHLGYGGLWIGGGNPDPAAFARIESLLSATSRLVVATGITSIWTWEPAALAARAARLEAAYPGRFVLGLGVSHAPVVEQVGRRYERPFEAMVAYLDALDALAPGAAGTLAPGAAGAAPPRVLAALGPRMLRLSAARASGAHPYLTTPRHTRHARDVLGPSAFLGPEQAIVLQDRPEVARRRARAYLERYLRLPNYAVNLLRTGWSAADVQGGGSDALVDALVVHGNVDQVRASVEAHLDAGADHVCVQALGEDTTVDRSALEVLAPLLTAG